MTCATSGSRPDVVVAFEDVDELEQPARATEPRRMAPAKRGAALRRTVLVRNEIMFMLFRMAR